MRHKVTTRKHILYACVAFVTIVLGMQLVAATAWTADMANAGPCVTIIQLSQDPDSDWATNDLVARLSEFIHDDPFITNRINVIKTSDPYYAELITDSIVIYVSHGGPIGIVTGDRLTSWRTMAEIVTESKAIMHLFTSCYSRNIIRYGNSESGEKLYTVPGARPAEVTNVEITTTVMLAFGIDAEAVEQYRTSELTAAKELIESEVSIHIMDFDQIILDEIEAIDTTYSDTYTDTHRVYRFTEEDTLTGMSGFLELPNDIHYTFSLYFRSYLDSDGQTYTLDFLSCMITYIRNYYYEAEWIVDYIIPDPDDPPDPGDPPDPDDPIRDPGDPPIGPESVSLFYVTAAAATTGHWDYGPNIFCGGTYSGMVTFWKIGASYSLTVNITASGPTIDAAGKTEIDSMSLRAIAPKGTYVQNQKVDGVWGEPVVGRDPARTGGLWTDSATKADYEYTPNVLPIPSPISTGSLSSNGDFIYVTSIPTGTGWHGPTFIRTLPSYFKIGDLGSFSANLSLVHGGIGSRKSQTCVSLYDENMKIILSLMIVDASSGQYVYFVGACYDLDGSVHPYPSQTFSGDKGGIVTMRYDPQVGLYVKLPGESYEHFLIKSNQIDLDRLIKYVAIQSYRYGAEAEHDERIYNIRLSYAASEYTVFHDNCNDMDNFHQSSDYGYGVISDGTIEVPSGQSYMTLTDVDAHFSTTGWSFNKIHHLNGVPGAGTNYQILITAHYGSGTDSGQDVYLNNHAKIDFGDVRFVSSDGTSFLDYWCESVVVGSYAKFWVKISDNLDYGQDIYIAYGNSAAASMSNGDATFIFFDDFNDASIDTNKWDTYGTCSESSGYATLTTTKSTNTAHACMRSDNTYSFQNTAFAARFQYDQWGNREWGISMADSDYVPLCYQISGASSTYNDHYIDTDGGGYDEYSNWVSISLDTFNRRECMMTTTGTTWTCDSSEHTYSAKTMPAATGKLFLGFYIYGYSGAHNTAVTELDFDWVYVRKSVDSDNQIHGDWGSEVGVLNIEDWSYRKSHHINGVPGAGVDYQIPITAHYGSGTDAGLDVYLNGHSKTDFSDIRFTTSDGTTLLDYWCESVSASNYAKFWVKISENLDYNQEIYIYYGNGAAQSSSNGKDTFLFFDDFEDQNLAEWDTTNGYDWQIVSNVVNQGSYAAYCDGGVAGRGMIAQMGGLDYGFMIHADAREASTPGYVSWGVGTGDDGLEKGYYSLYFDSGSLKYYIGTTYAWPQNSAYSTNTWYELELGMNPITDKRRAWKNGLYMGETDLLATDGISTFADIDELRVNSGSGSVDDIWIDEYYVRKWVESEPTQGVWGVEEGTAGWHGPNYVHVLDRPFRLFQLSEFSVLAGLTQNVASYMGKTGVALYDNNKQCIMTVEWCDDGSGEVDGWLKAIFYPQSGAPYQRFLWYGDSSMLTGVRLWWDPYTGGPGAIYVRSDVAPYNYLLGACVNASRVVCYVVVMGQGYASNPILDMRIHDINVEADPNKRVPTEPEPVEADGTTPGSVSETDTETIESDMEVGFSLLSVYWTGPWPLLHFVTEVEVVPENLPPTHPAKPSEGKTLTMHTARNLLRETEINDVSADGGTQDLFSGEWGEILILDILLTFMTTPARLVAAVVENAAWTGNGPLLLISVAVMTALLVIAYKVAYDFTMAKIESGNWSYSDAGFVWVWLAVSLLLSLIGVDVFFLFPMLFGAIPLGFAAKAMNECDGIYEMMLHSLFALVIMAAFALTLLATAAAFFCQSLVQ